METTAKQQMREYAERWKWLGPELERIRWAELPGTDTARAIGQLGELFDETAKLPPRETSGLVEQQAIFKKVWEKLNAKNLHRGRGTPALPD